MKTLIFFISLIFIGFLANASPPPDFVSFDSDTCIVLQIDHQSSNQVLDAQEVAFNFIGNSYTYRMYAQISFNHVYVFDEKMRSYPIILSNLQISGPDLFLLKTPLSAQESYKFTVAINKQHSNYGYPFSAN